MPLEDKAKRLAEARKPLEFDWKAARTLWLSELGKLHDQIGRWLEPLREKSLVTLKKTPVRISEEHAGVYAADALVLEFGDEGIVVDPMGANVVGARGRVDVYRRGNRRAAVMLLLSGSEDAPTWEVWKSADSRDRARLDQRVFEEILESLLPA